MIIIPGGMPPRACLGYSLTQIFGIMDRYRMAPGLLNELSDAITPIKKEISFIRNEAESIGRSIAFSIPVLYTSAGYEGIAIRMRQQLNENAKMLCWHHTVPEMNHNELVGWVEKSPRVSAIFMRNSDEYYRTSKRMEICKEIIHQYAGKTIEIWSKGQNPVERTLFWIHLGDWISWYASVERNQDAMNILVIEKLKDQLSKLQ
jgi:glucose/mannose-6-phosphate isomerase